MTTHPKREYTTEQIENQIVRLKQLEQMGESFRVTHSEFRELHDILESLASQLAAQKREDVKFRLWDTQWMNIVNHDNAYRDWTLEDAVAYAVRVTEAAMARNIKDGKWPTAKSPSPDQDREVSS